MKTTIPNDFAVVYCFHGGKALMMKTMRTLYNNNEKRNRKGVYAVYNQSERNENMHVRFYFSIDGNLTFPMGGEVCVM